MTHDDEAAAGRVRRRRRGDARRPSRAASRREPLERAHHASAAARRSAGSPADDVAVLVSDYEMPEMTGAQLAGHARRVRPETVRILLTGKRTLETAIDGINQGEIFRFLNKPFDNDELRRDVAAAVERNQELLALSGDRERRERRERLRAALEAEYPGISRIERNPGGHYDRRHGRPRRRGRRARPRRCCSRSRSPDVAHTTVAGEPCAVHAPRADDLLAPAALGTACFAALHDLASALQAIGNAIDELDVTVTDPAVRPLVDAAIEANDNATKMFVAIRGVLRDPAGRKQPVEVAALMAARPIRPRPGRSSPDAAAGHRRGPRPVVAMALAKPIDAATTAGGGGAPELAPRADGGMVALAITAAAAGPRRSRSAPPLAIAAQAIEAHHGTVQCGAREGRQTSSHLPLSSR